MSSSTTLTGTDTLVLALSEDAYLGNATFTVSVDGVQIGGAQSVTALHLSNQTENFVIKGAFGNGPHKITITFLNDLYNSSIQGGDRNLYVNSLSLDGTTIIEAAAQDNAGSASYTIQSHEATTVVTPPAVTIATPVQTAASSTVTLTGTLSGAAGTAVEIYNGTSALGTATLNGSGGWSYATSLATGSYNFSAVATDLSGNTATATDPAFFVYPQTDTLVLSLSEDSYLGVNAQFTISVNGTQIGGTQYVTALHSAGQVENFVYTGAYGNGADKVVVTFLNAASGSTGARNLYYSDITINGYVNPQTYEQKSSSAQSFTVNTPAKLYPSVVPTVTIGTPLQTAATAIVLSGTYTGAAGTSVEIYSGSTAVGTASLNNDGTWIYGAIFTPGNYNFSAVATDLTNNTATATAPVFSVYPQSDTIVLGLSEDAYLGNAAFTVNVDGTQVGGTQTVTASHTAGQTENFVLLGNFGPGAHTVAVTFTNDLNGGTAGDRNLYINTVTMDGSTFTENHAQTSNGTASFSIVAPNYIIPPTAPTITIAAPVQTIDSSIVTLSGSMTGAAGTAVEIYNGATAIGTATLNGSGGWSFTTSLVAGSYNFKAVATDLYGSTATAADPAYFVYPTTDTLVLSLAEDAYLGDAQFTVSVDGTQIGGVQSVTASQAAGQTENFALTGAFGPGPHTVAVNFTNDASGPGGDRNLYIDGITLDGQTTPETWEQKSAGAAYFTVTTPATVTTVKPPAVTIATPVQTAASSTVTLTGTLSGAAGTAVEIYNGTSALGTATLNGSGGWSYATSLATGSYNFSAVATDLSGNTATATDPAFFVYPQTDTLVLSLSEDSYLGVNAQFTISVNGTQIGGTQYVTALHSAGQVENFVYTGAYGNGADKVVVTFLNAASGSTGARNLYYSDITINGYVNPQTYEQKSSSAQSFTVNTPAKLYPSVVPTVTIGTPLQTAATAIVLSGTYTGAAGTSVEIYSGSTAVGTASLNNDGTWIYGAIFTPGNYNFSAVATDLTNNTATATAPVFSVYPQSDTIVLGLSEDAYLGNAAFTVNVDGTQVGGTQTVTASHTAGQTENFVLLGNFGPGAHTVAVTFTNDLNGGTAGDRNLYINTVTMDGSTFTENHAQTSNGTASFSIVAPNYIIPPTAPTITIAAPVQTIDSSIVTLSGSMTGAAGTAVEIYNGATAIGTATLNGSGGWSFTGDLSPGAYNFKAVATDLYGATASATDPVFSVAYPAPVVTIASQVLARDTGISATDNVTSNGAITLTGTVGGTAGTTVQIKDGATVLGNATVNNTGGWSFATTLAAGTHSLSAIATDPAGNSSSTTAEPTIIVETSAPAVSITSQVLAQDTGASASDNITSNGGITLSGTISGAPGTVVQIADGTAILGNATLNNSGGWSFTTTLSTGTHVLTAIATDPAGNSSRTAAEPTIMVETSAPVITIAAQVLADDTGISATDNVTNNGAVTLTGAVNGAGGTIVQILDGTNVLGTATLNNSGGWSFATTLGAGSHALFATATDLAGNSTSTPTEPVITVLTAVPQVAITTQVLTDDTGSSSTDNITSDGAVTLTGTVTGTAGTLVQIIDGGTVLGTATQNGSGGWSYATTLGAGSHALTAIATDQAGNTASSAPAPLIIVENGALAVYITSQVLTQDTGVSATDNVTSNGAVTLTGVVSGPAGTTVQVLDGSTVLGAATVGTDGSWNFATTLGAGSHALSATATDPAGNTLTSTAEPVIIVETTPPVVSITSQVLTQDTGASATDNITSNGAVTLTGTFNGAAGTIVQIADGTTVLGNATLNNSGGWSFATTLSPGTHTLNAIATDPAGNSAATAKQPAITVDTTAPGVTITSQVLAHDTGASGTDNITSNGAVTLTGTVSGGPGVIVQVLDGTVLLGTATLNGNGGWSYATTLGTGTHALAALATDLAGNTTTTPAEPVITVETTPPGVSITAPVQTAGTTTVTVSGTVSGPAGTSVKIYNGATVLGTATVSNGSWSFAASLAAGAYNFTATATDPAGNAASVSDAAFTVTNPLPIAPATVTAYENTGTGTRGTVTVTVSSPTPTTGTLVPLSAPGSLGLSPLVLYNWNPSTQLTHFLAAEAAVAAGTPNARAKIVSLGDSTTLGYGSATANARSLSYTVELARSLTQDGITSQYDNFLAGPDTNDTRLSLVNGAYWWVGGGPVDGGGYVVNTNTVGEGIDFTLNTPGNYNRVDISYIDMGSGSVSVAIDGGPVLTTLHFGNTGQTLTQTVDIPAGLHSEVSLRATAPNNYIEGISFWNSTSPSVEVYNSGIAGWDSTEANTSTYQGNTLLGSTNGYGETAGAAEQDPNLAIIDIGINDINSNLDTTAQTINNISQMVASLRSVGSDVIIMIPQPFGDNQYATALPALRSALQSLSLAQNVPLIDLSATYGNNFSALYNGGLMYDTLHPDATLYADIGSQLAALLTSATTSTSTSVTMAGSSGNDTLTGTSTANTLVGNGGSDIYVLNATNQNDTIVNGSSTTTTAQGELSITNANHNQLWLAQSGNNLVVDVLGTTEQATIQNWYSGNAGAKLQTVLASDNLKLDSSLQTLVQAMASFSANNPNFNPMTTTHTTLTDSYFGSTLAASATSSWHT